MDEYIITCIQDVANACEEVESFFADRPRVFENFRQDMLRIRAVERNVEIMGEALNRIRHHDSSFPVPNDKAIVETRNRVIHGYDSVTPEFLWTLVINHIPKLHQDVKKILSEYESDSEQL